MNEMILVALELEYKECDSRILDFILEKLRDDDEWKRHSHPSIIRRRNNMIVLETYAGGIERVPAAISRLKTDKAYIDRKLTICNLFRDYFGESFKISPLSLFERWRKK